MRRDFGLCLLLAAITLATFWPVGHLGFIRLDDPEYVLLNRFVNTGLSGQNIAWAFTSAFSGNWHPITWMSHMLDCELFGLNPAGPHWINLGFHAANAILLFIWLRRLTGACWRSFLVAALFACHPLHIQSVAWISERKDVLSGFFALLTLMAYAEYCRKKTSRWHILTLLLFALGLMAKPMLVTLPLVMLLLDYWPLNRVDATVFYDLNKESAAKWQPLLVQKAPLFILSLGSCAATLWAQSLGNAVVSLQQLNGHFRAAHAVYSYSLYLGKLLWPANLAIFYPYTRMDHGKQALLFIIPCVLSFICLRRSRFQPYLFVGWFWFVVTLIPVIGLVQVGVQSIADRYMYLPSVGLFIALAWGMAEFAEHQMAGAIPLTENIGQKPVQMGNRPIGLRLAMAGLGFILVAACVADTRCQLAFWKDDVSLFQRVVKVTPENAYFGYCCLGNGYWAAGDLTNAAKSYAESIAANADYIDPREHLAQLLMHFKKFSEAEQQYREIIKINPHYYPAYNLLGIALVRQEKDAEAAAEFETAMNYSPNNPALRGRLAVAQQRATAENALKTLAEQSGAKPTASAEAQMGDAQALLENYQLAIEHYEKALALEPNCAEALNGLAWLLATCPNASLRDAKKAIQLAESACELTKFKRTIFIGTLAAAFAQAGNFDEAIATAQKACANATALNESDLLSANQNLLELYQQHNAFQQRPLVGN